MLIFANSHDMLLLKFDLLNGLTGTLWAWHGTQCCRMPCTCTFKCIVVQFVSAMESTAEPISETCNSNSSLHLCIRGDNKNNVPQMH